MDEIRSEIQLCVCVNSIHWIHLFQLFQPFEQLNWTGDVTWPQFTGEWNKLIEVFEFNFPMNSIFYCFINQRQELSLIKKIARQFCQSL